MNDAYTKEVDSVILELKTSQEQGLTSHEAETRLHEYGLNLIQEEHKISPFKILIEQFKSPLVWILIVATIVSLFLEEYIDAGVIGAIVILNAILGFIQEYKAERAIEALRKMASPKAKVIRDGQEKEIESRYLVPGDILVLETGDKIPADARLIEIHSLETQEASLTGESTPVIKELKPVNISTPLGDRHNMVFFGTIVTKGRAKAVVAGTGMKTEFGKIATLIQTAEQELTPLQKQLKNLGKWLGIAVLGVAVLVFAAGLIRESIIGTLNTTVLQKLFLVAIALAVAAIPEGLPAVVTISLSLGVKRMIKRNALVRKLPSVETLGSVDVICSDKTGTLTKNEMTVKKIWNSDKIYEVTGAGYGPEGTFVLDKQITAPNDDLKKLLLMGALCNDSKLTQENEQRKVIGDPTEACLLVSAEKAGIKKSEIDKTYPRLDEIPFSSERKCMTTINSVYGKKVALTKGAPDVILQLCDRILINGKVLRLSRPKIKEILEINEKFASEALRVLGFAYKDAKDTKDSEKNLVFIGLQAMIDPPREEVKEAIQRAKIAGIRTIMITGDHKTTAVAIAKELGIEGRAITGQDVEKMLDSDFNKQVDFIGIYARVNPEHKIKIITALKNKGYTVAMTGDGVNDAPALKKADMGIAMGITGTDVSKEASDMILTDDNFASIVNAVEEGRNIFDNIRKFVIYLLSSNSGEVLIILLSMLVGLPLPLIAVQILWINLITDGAPATALGVEPAEPGIMQRKPIKHGEHVVTKQRFIWIILVGLIMTLGTLGVFTYALLTSGWTWGTSIGFGAPPHYYLYAITISFTTLMLFQMFNVINCKELRISSLRQFFSNKWLLGAILLSIILQIAVVYVPFLNQLFSTIPLSIGDWIVSIAVASSVLWFGEIYKLVFKQKVKQ
ncbi:MAG: calcium-translocating P-type ATPase, SERCA-type [Nanoarchaeota archaeon]|nr:calcium-translocating P-type ATPase, SERCA-type [Nanoarchaeota archaeon]